MCFGKMYTVLKQSFFLCFRRVFLLTSCCICGIWLFKVEVNGCFIAWALWNVVQCAVWDTFCPSGHNVASHFKDATDQTLLK